MRAWGVSVRLLAVCTIFGCHDERLPGDRPTAAASASPSQIRIAAAGYSVPESGGSLTITLERVGGTAGTVSVVVETGGGSATAGADYVALSDTVIWGDGDAADKTATLTILPDAAVEGDESVDLVLSGATGGATLGSPSTAAVTIQDDDTPSAGALQFSAASYAQGEGSGTVVITVTRTGGSTGAVDVSYATSDGTAAEPGDYTATSGTLSWADGETAPKTFSVPIVDDVDAEPGGDETLDLSLSAPTNGAVLGSQKTAVLSIVDDDQGGVLQFSAAVYTVSETGPAVTVSVTRTGGSLGAVGVAYATADGTAAENSDYEASSGTLSWGDGDTSAKTFTVPILNDATPEPGGNETILLSLSSPTGGALLGAQSSAAIHIVDNDQAGSLQFSSAFYVVSEAGPVVIVTVTRINGSLGPVGVTYSTSNGTATAGSDYSSASGTLSWADGETTDQTFTVPILEDGTDEGDETFAVALSSPTGGATLGTPADATITIDDNDSPGTIHFVSPAASQTEGDGANLGLLVWVRRDGGGTGSVSVSYAVHASSTATSGIDFLLMAGTLTWADGETGDKAISVTLIGEIVPETDETIVIELSAPTNGATLSAPSTHTLTIIDDD